MYGQPPPGYVMRTGPPPSAGTAKTLILIGLIFQAIIAVISLVVLGGLALLAALVSPFFGFAIIGPIIFLIFGGIDVILLYVAYEYSYKRTSEGQYEAARTPTLILGILGIFIGFFITGIFYIIGYVKLGDAVNEMQQPAYVYPGPFAGQPMQPMQPMAPAATPFQPSATPAAPTCPRCGRPATWVPQYNRWFCTNDQQYL